MCKGSIAGIFLKNQLDYARGGLRGRSATRFLFIARNSTDSSAPSQPQNATTGVTNAILLLLEARIESLSDQGVDVFGGLIANQTIEVPIIGNHVAPIVRSAVFLNQSVITLIGALRTKRAVFLT